MVQQNYFQFLAKFFDTLAKSFFRAKSCKNNRLTQHKNSVKNVSNINTYFWFRGQNLCNE